MTIDWDHTMVWFPASLLKTRRLLSTCAAAMHVLFIHARRCFVTMAEMMYGLTTLDSNNFVGYGQKLKVSILVFLVRTS